MKILRCAVHVLGALAACTPCALMSSQALEEVD